MTTRYDIGGAREVTGDSYGSGMPMTVTRSGWSICAAILLGLLGVVNVVFGFTLLERGELVAAEMLYVNFTFWGWAFLAWGCVQVLSAGLAAAAPQGGIQLALLVTVAGVFGWFLMIFAAPIAAMVSIGISLIVLAGLSSAFD